MNKSFPLERPSGKTTRHNDRDGDGIDTPSRLVRDGGGIGKISSFRSRRMGDFAVGRGHEEHADGALSASQKVVRRTLLFKPFPFSA